MEVMNIQNIESHINDLYHAMIEYDNLQLSENTKNQLEHILDKIEPQNTSSIENLQFEKIIDFLTNVAANDYQKRLDVEVNTGRDELDALSIASNMLVDELESKQKELEEVQKVTKIGNWSWNIFTDETFWSDQLYEILDIEDIENNQLDYKKFTSYIYPKDKNKVFHKIRNSLRTNEDIKVDFRVITLKHRIKFVTVQGKIEVIDSEPGKMYGICKDVTKEKRKQLVQELTDELSRKALQKKYVLREILEHLNQKLLQIFDFDQFYVAEYSNSNSEVVKIYDFEHGFFEYPLNFNEEIGLLKHLIKNDSPLKLSEREKREYFKKNNIDDSFLQFKSCLGVGIHDSQEVCGAFILISNKSSKAFCESDLEDLQYIANHFGMILEKIKTLQKLKESERRFRSILENLNVIALQIDLEGNILFANQKLCELNGYSNSDKLIGLNWFDHFVHETTLEKTIKHHEESIESKELRSSFTNKIKIKGAIARQIRWISTFLYDENNQVYGLSSLGYDITERKRLEKKITQHSKLDQFLAKRKRKTTLRNIIHGQEHERKRISQELHDGIGQQLIGLKFAANAIKRRNKEITTEVNTLTDYINEIIQEVRRISYSLLPSVLSDFGLVAGVERVVSIYQNGLSDQIEINLNVKGEPYRFHENKELAFFRVFQESLNNSIKHSKTDKIEVNVGFLPEKISLSVRDYGIWKDFSDSNLKDKYGNGLINMYERVESENAKLLIDSNEEGTTISVELDLV